MIDIEKIKKMTVEELRNLSSKEIQEVTNSDPREAVCPGEPALTVPKNCTLFCRACSIRQYGLYNGYYID